MTKRERLLRVLNRKEPDRIPWLIYPLLTIFGEAELRYRNMGLSYYVPRPVHHLVRENVDIWDKVSINEKDQVSIIQRHYATPKGEIIGKYKIPYEAAPQTLEEAGLWHPSCIPGEGTWTVEYPFRSVDDYPVLEFIIENSIYTPDYDKYYTNNTFLGDEGIVMAGLGKSPFQAIIYDWMGHETCFFEVHDHPDKFNRLYDIMYEKQLELCKIAAESPADIVWEGENVTEVLTAPKYFEQYCMPFYKKIAPIIHEKGKLYGAHLDGQLLHLKDLIAKTPFDFIDAVTPPPLGNLPIEEARASWTDKTIICNFPENVYHWKNDDIKKYMIELLKKVAPGNNFILSTTENYPSDRWVDTFDIIGEILDKCGSYPVKL